MYVINSLWFKCDISFLITKINQFSSKNKFQRIFLILILFSRIVFFFRKTTKKIEMFFTISISYLNCYIAEKLVCYTLQERPLLLANSRSSLS